MVKREFSAGGVVCKKVDGEIFWLIIKPKQTGDFYKAGWRLPKGWIDEGEKPEETALREVAEESGVKAEIIKKIDILKYLYTNEGKEKVFKVVTFYLMKWVENLPEGFGWETEEIAWLAFDEASKQLAFGSEKKVLKKAEKEIESGFDLEFV